MYFFNESWKCLRIYMCAHNRKNKGKNKWKHSIELNVRFYYVPCFFFHWQCRLVRSAFLVIIIKPLNISIWYVVVVFFSETVLCKENTNEIYTNIWNVFINGFVRNGKKGKTQSVSFSSFWTTFGSKWFAAIDT